MLEFAEQQMQQAITDSVFPSGELLVARHGNIIHHGHYGSASTNTIFDIASLTKPLATATLCMQLVNSGELYLDKTIPRYLPRIQRSAYANATLRQLLTHTAGFPAWFPFYKNVKSEIGTPEAMIEILESVLATPPAYTAGKQSIYSDLGYMLLGAIIENVGGAGIEQQFEEHVAHALGLDKTFYAPLEQSLRTTPRTLLELPTNCEFAKTELCEWRGKLINKEVHDQNCYAMGGVAGHAGLFSNALDLHTYLHQLVACWRGHSDWIHQEVVQNFLDFERLEKIENSTHLAGWDTPSKKNKSSAGTMFSEQSIGHLGFTGCSMWVDLTKRFWVILLTNRVSPTTNNEKIKTFRPQIHDAIAAEIFKK